MSYSTTARISGQSLIDHLAIIYLAAKHGNRQEIITNLMILLNDTDTENFEINKPQAEVVASLIMKEFKRMSKEKSNHVTWCKDD